MTYNSNDNIGYTSTVTYHTKQYKAAVVNDTDRMLLTAGFDREFDYTSQLDAALTITATNQCVTPLSARTEWLDVYLGRTKKTTFEKVLFCGLRFLIQGCESTYEFYNESKTIKVEVDSEDVDTEGVWLLLSSDVTREDIDSFFNDEDVMDLLLKLREGAKRQRSVFEFKYNCSNGKVVSCNYNNIIAFDRSFYRFAMVNNLWSIAYLNSYVNLDRINTSRGKEVNFIKERKFLDLFKDNLKVRGSNDGITECPAEGEWWGYEHKENKNREHILYDNVKIFITWNDKVRYKWIEAHLYSDRVFLDVSPEITKEQLELVLKTTDILERRKKAKSLMGEDTEGNGVTVEGSFRFRSLTTNCISIKFDYIEKKQ